MPEYYDFNINIKLYTVAEKNIPMSNPSTVTYHEIVNMDNTNHILQRNRAKDVGKNQGM